MIDSMDIRFSRNGDPEDWSMRIELKDEDNKKLSPIVVKHHIRIAEFEGAGPLSKAIAFIPEALKAMGIAEAGSEPAYPTQNATEVKQDPIAPARAVVDEYNKAMEKLADKAKKEIVHGPEVDQDEYNTTKALPKTGALPTKDWDTPNPGSFAPKIEC